MKSKQINRQIFNLAVPNIISNLSVPLLSAVDTALVGHLPSPVYIGAVAVGSMIFNFVYWGFGFLRMGTTGLTAQAFGKNDRQEVGILLQRALFVAFASGITLILLQYIIATVSFALISATPEVEANARIYFFIRIFAAPATLSLYAIHGWFLGVQNARFPLLVTIAVNLLNIVFDVLFVLGLGMKSDGVALGTVLSQYLGFGLSVFLLMRRYREYLHLHPLHRILSMEPLMRFIKVNTDIFIRTLSLIFVFSFFTAKSAELGEVPLAANSVLIQLWMFFSYGIDGFAFAAESLVGKYLGAGDRDRLTLVMRRIFVFGLSLAAVFSLMYGGFKDVIPMLFTGQKPVLELIGQLIGWTIFAPIPAAVCYIWDGIFIGATATRGLRNAMLICAFLIYLPLHYFLTAVWQVDGMWCALLCFMIARGISLTLLSPKYLGISLRHLLKKAS